MASRSRSLFNRGRRALSITRRHQHRRMHEVRASSCKSPSVSSHEALANAARRVPSTSSEPRREPTLATLSCAEMDQLNVSRCPSSPTISIQRFTCPRCPKVFAFEQARDNHLLRHETHFHQCSACLWLSPNAVGLEKHKRMHQQTELILCLSCGDEYSSTQHLNAHVEREPLDHGSKREFVHFASESDLWDSFPFQAHVVGNSLVHTTTHHSAQDAVRQGGLRGSRASRPHDGVLRRDDAGKAVFFTASDSISSVSPHPVYAEAGELTTSILLPLDTFVRSPGEYRMFLVSCLPAEGMKYDEAPLRTTVVLASSELWQWCEERGLLELDIHHNPILGVHALANGGFEWEVATHCFVPDLGVRTTKVVVAVAGDRIQLENVNSSIGSGVTMLDTSQVFRHDHRVRCPGCDESFAHEQGLYTHLEAPSRSSLVCPVTSCDDMFISKRSLNSHLARHFDERPYKCRADPDCHETFRQSAARSRHELLHNEDPDLFACDEPSCTYSTRWKSNLATHKINRHSDERPHKCSECEKPFKTRGKLSDHMAVHSDERPYACRVDPICDARFKSSTRRNAHETVHSKDANKLTCGHCNTFSTLWQKNLQTHTALVHTDLRPFECRADPSCHETFKLSSVRSKHELGHSMDMVQPSTRGDTLRHES